MMIVDKLEIYRDEHQYRIRIQLRVHEGEFEYSDSALTWERAVDMAVGYIEEKRDFESTRS